MWAVLPLVNQLLNLFQDLALESAFQGLPHTSSTDPFVCMLTPSTMSAFLGYSAVENSGEEALFLEAWECRELLRAIFFLVVGRSSYSSMRWKMRNRWKGEEGERERSFGESRTIL